MLYKCNSSMVSKSMAVWFFGASFVKAAEAAAKAATKKEGHGSRKFWQDGTGYLTVIVGK